MQRIFDRSLRLAAMDIDLVKKSAIFAYPGSKKAMKVRETSKKEQILREFIAVLALMFIISIVIEVSSRVIASSPLQYYITFPSWLFIYWFLPFIASFSLIAAIFMVKNDKSLFIYAPKIMAYLLIYSGGFYFARVSDISKRRFEIPMFKNMYLSYRATGEYAKFLKRLKIEPYEYKQVFLLNKYFKRKQMVANNKLWRAEFLFSKVPKTGDLKVFFV